MTLELQFDPPDMGDPDEDDDFDDEDDDDSDSDEDDDDEEEEEEGWRVAGGPPAVRR